MILAYLAFFGIIFWYWFKLLRWMLRGLWLVHKAHKAGLLVPPRSGRMGYMPERIALSEAESIERGITGLGGHGMDSMWPL
jgi:hypothetical protein